MTAIPETLMLLKQREASACRGFYIHARHFKNIILALESFKNGQNRHF